jgi:hypothetical protein
MDDLKLAESSSDFISAFADFAKRLAAISVWIDRLDLHYGGFGSWELIVRKGDEAVKFFFDGRDGYIEVETSPKPLYENSSARNWTKAGAKALDRSKAIPYTEGFLKEKFGTSAN